MKIKEESNADTNKKSKDENANIQDLLLCSRSFHMKLKQIRQYIIEQLHEMSEKENKAENEYNKKLNDMKLYIDTIDNENEKQEKIFSFFKILIRESPSRYSDILIQSLFLNIFSLFDAFIGDFLEIMYKLRPCLLTSDSKQVSVNKVFSSKSIEDFKSKYLRELIDDFRRDSYVEQVENMQKLFHIKTLIAFVNWPTFVEITQRRNIIKHCDGKISQDYIDICSKHGCDMRSIEVGQKLSIDLDYLVLAINVTEEVGIKLLHTIWRKQLSDSIEISDMELITGVYNLLLDENWELALCLSEFGMNQKNLYNEENLLMLTVNHCIALYNMGEKEKLNKVLSSIDFSAKSIEFKLAKEVLFDNYDEAYNLMKSIGTNGKFFKQGTYLVFPLFKQIRKEGQFKEVYTGIFKNSDYREVEKGIELSKDIEQDIQNDIERINS